MNTVYIQMSAGFELLTHYTMEMVVSGTSVPGQCYDPAEEQRIGPILKFVRRVYTIDRVGINN